ncbi:MAG: SAM-dependent methyltransferase [Lachnospiraceae bacterium]|nr:SAM-dependent methyltransferase [Lachnospiraceae bacterium]
MQNTTTKRLTGKRLSAVAALVTPGLVVADIGCDHGWVPIHLVGTGISPKAFAMDVRKGPLSIAEEHIRQAGLENQIETRLSDGLTALAAKEAESIIIAGMGGPLIRKILSEGEGTAKSAGELIISPHSEWKECREYLLENGYEILTERMVEEEGKYYLILKLRPGDVKPDYGADIGDRELALYYGAELLLKKDPVLRAYLLKERATLEALLIRIGEADSSGNEGEGTHGAKRCQEIRKELLINEKALKMLGEEANYEVQ